MARELRIQIRRDSAANWQAVNPALRIGELGLDTTAKRIKIGDGFTDWNSLEYAERGAMDELRNEYGNEVDFVMQLELNK